MDPFDEVFDYDGDGKLDFWETLDRDTADNISFQTTQKKDESSPSQGGTQGCYIATCVYGSYDCAPVWTLRRFRDDILAKSAPGRLFICLYYAISPWLVKRFGDRKVFKAVWRRMLDSLVARLKANGISSSPYNDR